MLAQAGNDPRSLSARRIHETARDAYIYGFPLVLVDVTRQVLTARRSPSGNPNNGLGNQFMHFREFPDPSVTWVASPNADTLYSVAFLDLTSEPGVLSLPETGERYYLLQIMDAWTNVFVSLGSRTSGNMKRRFLLVGPSSRGTVIPGARVLECPTSMVWAIGRIQTDGKKDYPAVHTLQDRFELSAQSAIQPAGNSLSEGSEDQSIDVVAPPLEQVTRMKALTFFRRLNRLMKANPPSPFDAAALRLFARIGVKPSTDFNLDSLDAELAASLDTGVCAGHEAIESEARKRRGLNINGWEFMYDVGRYGTNYLRRAVAALVGLGANMADDAVYPRATVDSYEEPLTGAHRYQLRFVPGGLPPVNAFWSITVYNSKQSLVPNPIGRYAIGSRDNLQFASDGSLTLYVQADSPGAEKESNWLPVPRDGFSLVMGLYWPKEEILCGSWIPPRIDLMHAYASALSAA